MSVAPALIAADYWERRARQFADRDSGLAAVCSYGMPAFYNDYIHYCQRRALLPWLPRARTPDSRALDIGCGVGRWSWELAERGHNVTGVDISPCMIEQARRRTADAATQCSFLVSDVAELAVTGSFQVIVCVTVLQHILQPQRVQSSLAHLAAHLAPDGRLILLEAAPARSTPRCDHSAFHARSARWYRATLQSVGLRPVATRGVDPMPFKTWLLPHYRRLRPPLAKLALALTTAVSLPLDCALARWLTESSWHKVLVAEHA